MRNALPSPKTPADPVPPGGEQEDGFSFDVLLPPEPVKWDEEEPEATEFLPVPEDIVPDGMEWAMDDDPAPGWTDPAADSKESAPDALEPSDDWALES